MISNNASASSNGSTSATRTFPLTLAAGFSVLTLLAWWRGHALLAAVTGFLAFLALIGALFFSTRLRPLERAWMKMGEAIGSITTPVLLTVVYYIVLTPVGLLRRAFAVRAKKPESSYWHPRPPSPPSSRMERQF